MPIFQNPTIDIYQKMRGKYKIWENFTMPFFQKPFLRVKFNILMHKPMVNFWINGLTVPLTEIIHTNLESLPVVNKHENPLTLDPDD